MTDTVLYRFLLRRGMAAALESTNEVPLQGEIYLELDTGLGKIGDGVTHYNDLFYTIAGRVDLSGLAPGKVLIWQGQDTSGPAHWVVADFNGVPNGGALNQVLTKLSGADQDIGWRAGGGGGSGFNIADYFTGSTVAFGYDLTDASKLFQDTAGTIPVTTAGQSIALIKDISGKGYDAVQATTANQAKWGVNARGAPCAIFSSGNYYTNTAVNGSRNFSFGAAVTATTNGGRILDNRGTGAVGTVRGIQVKPNNSAADGVTVDGGGGAGTYMTINANGHLNESAILIGRAWPTNLETQDSSSVSQRLQVYATTTVSGATTCVNANGFTIGKEINAAVTQPFVGNLYHLMFADINWTQQQVDDLRYFYAALQKG